MDSLVNSSTAKYSAVQLAELLGKFEPTEEQIRIIEAGPEPLLVVAGAGSGKTATMTDRVVWLVANGLVKPEEVLGVTFTRKAAGELATRINQAIETLVNHPDLDLGIDPDELGLASVSTYHSYANTLVQDHGLRIGVEPEAELIGDAQAHLLVAEIVENWDDGLASADIPTSTLVSSVRRLSDDLSEHLREPEEVKAEVNQILSRGKELPVGGRGTGNDKTREMLVSLPLRAVMADMVLRYREVKQERSVMDYGDLVRYAQRIATEIPEVGEIERAKYKVVLLDEFQDTSYAQLKLFSGLFGSSGANNEEGAGVGHCVTAVGDPNQSIYGFRGASSGQLFAFAHEFPQVTRDAETGEITERKPAETVHLTTAWRNGKRILSGANAVIDAVQQADRISGRAGSQAAVKRLNEAPKAADGQVVVNWFPDSETEASGIAEMLRERFAKAEAEGEDAESAAILTRTKSAFEPIIEALELAGVPYEVLGLTGLLSTPEVIELISILQVIADPRSNKALLRVLTNARWRIGAEDLVALHQRAKKLARTRRKDQTDKDEPAQPVNPHEKFRQELTRENAEQPALLEALLNLPGEEDNLEAARRAAAEPLSSKAEEVFSNTGLQRLGRLGELMGRLVGLRHLELPVLVRRIEKEIGLEAELLAHPGQDLTQSRRLTEAFLQVVEDFGTESDPTSSSNLLGFLGWLESAQDQERGLELPVPEPKPGAVQILTIHASKGLEWDLVVVPNMVEGTFPSKNVDLWTKKNTGMIPWSLRGDRDSLPQWDYEAAETQVDWAGAALGRTDAQEEKATYPSLKVAATEYYENEERRLAYVAFTRPKSLLWVSGSHWVGNNKTPAKPSQFLTLLDELDDQVSQRGTFVAAVDGDEIPEENPRAQRVFITHWPADPLDGPEIYQGKLADYWDETLQTHVVDIDDRAQKQPSRNYPRRAAVEASAALVEAHAEDSVEDISDEALKQRVAWALRAGAGRLGENEGERARNAVTVPTHLSTSGFIELVDDPQATARQLRRPMPQKPHRAARAGTLFHARVEEHFAKNRPGMTGMLDFEDPMISAADEEFDATLGVEEMMDQFLASQWAQRVPAFIETAIETTVGDITLRGRIDAIYREGGENPADEFDPTATWSLVDWKTGVKPRNQQELDKRALQLAVYRLAWSRLHNIPVENIEGVLVYVKYGADGEIRTDHLAGEEELERLLAEALGQNGQKS